jgi:hypothetical protein
MRYGILFLSLLACNNDEKESEVPPLSPTGEAGSCGGAPPVIDYLTCINSGLNFNEDEGEDLPTITIQAHVTDEDEDLTAYTMLVKFDQVVDGLVGDDAEEISVSGALQGELCAVPEADIGVRLYLRGGPPLAGTTYEWHVTPFDATGERGDTEIIVCTTPDENGEGDPNPQWGGGTDEDTGN